METLRDSAPCKFAIDINIDIDIEMRSIEKKSGGTGLSSSALQPSKRQFKLPYDEEAENEIPWWMQPDNKQQQKQQQPQQPGLACVTLLSFDATLM